MTASSTFSFPVLRREAVLVAPSSPTPYELKPLSDIDDQQGLRFHFPSLFVFRTSPGRCDDDPVEVIKEALARALVFYYPFAGRLRESGPDGKLVVECNAEGLVFVEADADVRLDQLTLGMPFPCAHQLIYDDIEGYTDVVGTPLLLIQVTRLRCGGFIFANRLNHPIADGQGLVQFMQAVAEMARGFDCPSLRPVWDRHLLSARDPPCVTHPHPEYRLEADTQMSTAPVTGAMVYRSFFFGPEDVSALKARLPPHLRSSCSRFEVLTAFVWRSRSIALYSDTPSEKVRVVCVVNGRIRSSVPLLPEGYYGNVLAFPMATSAAGRLESSGLGYAVELVKRAKGSVTEGYMQSVADLMVVRGRPRLVEERTYMVSDLTNAGSGRVDFGWGEPVYSGPVVGAICYHSFGSSFFTRHGNGILVPMCLPSAAMERFIDEIEKMKEKPEKEEVNGITSSSLILSSNL